MSMRLSLRLATEEEESQQQQLEDCAMLSSTAANATAHGPRGLTMLCMDTDAADPCVAVPCCSPSATDGSGGGGGGDGSGGGAHSNGAGHGDPHGDGSVVGSSCAPVFNSKRAKLDYFSRDCTAITDYLFVGGKKVASSHEKLSAAGITHIINAAGDVCDNYFPQHFHYLKLHLLDSAQEDIMCVLYKVIDFIDVVRKGKNKVLVHCQQGVSRSTVLAIAYLMYLENSDYDSVYEFVRARRGICRPNVGFMCQLLAWRKRVTRGSTRQHCMYRIGPHNARDKGLVTKWVDRVEVDSLDSRTLFMLQTNSASASADHANSASGHTPQSHDSAGGATVAPTSSVSPGALTPTPASASSSSSSSSIIYIWVGMLCPRESERQYIPYLAHLIAKIQQVEHAGKTVVLIRQKGRDKIERAEAMARANASPNKSAAATATPAVAVTNHSGPATLPVLPASPSHTRSHSGGASSCGPAFSSEHISAAFHTLESAPTILSASSLSSLYPAASPKQVSHFYRIVGLEESDEYARVDTVAGERRHPISGAILINPALDQEYPEVRVPDIEALNEVALKHAGGGHGGSSAGGSNGTTHAHRPYVLPPIVRVNVQADPCQSDEEEEQNGGGNGATMAADNDAAIEAYARNLCANSSASPLRFGTQRSSGGTSAGGGGDSDSPALTFTLPRKLNLVVASPDVEPLQVSSARSSPPRLALPSVAEPGAQSRPKLNLAGITFGGDDDAQDCVMTTDTPVHAAVSPALRAAAAAATPHHHSSLPASQAPTPHMAASPDATAAASSESAAAAPAPVPFSLASPGSGGPSHCLFSFPNFESGPIACSRSSLVAPGIFVLHARSTGALWVWLPGAGQLFIPSKYEGDREQFAGDIAKIFQLTFAAEIRSVQMEMAGKESKEFIALLDA